MLLMSIDNVTIRPELPIMLIGYARVSTEDQNLELQLAALKRASCKRIFTDKVSGAKADRPGLRETLSHLRETDTLVVWKLDRLGRSVKGLVDLETRKNRGLDWIASASVPMEVSSGTAVRGGHSRARSVSPPSLAPGFSRSP